MNPIKLHLTSAFTSYGLLRNDVFYSPIICNSFVQGCLNATSQSPIICNSFVQGCLNATSQNITLWVVPSKNGNIVIWEPIFRKKRFWEYKELVWKWYGQRDLRPLFQGLGERLEPGRYNVYISEGWV